MTNNMRAISVAVGLASCLLPLSAMAFSGQEGGKHSAEAWSVPGKTIQVSGLRLGGLVQAALGRSPEQVRLEALNERSRALFRRAGNLLAAQPALNLSGRTDQWQSDEGAREYQVGVGLPIRRFGERQAGRKLAEKTAEWVSADWNDVRLLMSGTIRELLWDYTLAENAIESANSALEMARKTESDMVRRVELGELSRSDLLLAKQQTLQREEELSAAIAEQHHTLMRYEVIVGSLNIPEDWHEKQTDVATISNQHPALYTLLKAVERARSEVSFLREKRGEPVTVGLTGYHSRGRSGEDYKDSLELTLGIPFGPKSYRDVPLAELQQQVADAEAALLSKRRNLDADLQEAKHRLHRVEVALKIADRAQQLSEQQLKMAQTAFKVGESNLFTLLLVQNKTVQTRRQFRETRIKRQRAIARYNQAAGVIPE